MFNIRFVKACETMWKQSVWSSPLAAHVASNHLKPNGTLVVMGAAGALSPTSGAFSPPRHLCNTRSYRMPSRLLQHSPSHTVSQSLALPAAYNSSSLHSRTCCPVGRHASGTAWRRLRCASRHAASRRPSRASLRARSWPLCCRALLLSLRSPLCVLSSCLALDSMLHSLASTCTSL